MVETPKSGNGAGSRPKTLNDSIHAQAAATTPSSGSHRVISIVGSARRSSTTGERNRSQSPSPQSRRRQSQRSGRAPRKDKKSFVVASGENARHATPEADLLQGVKGLTLGSPARDQTHGHCPRGSQQWNRSNGRNQGRGRNSRPPPATSEPTQVVSEDQRHRDANRQRKVQSIGHRDWDQTKDEPRGPLAKPNGATHFRTRQPRTSSIRPPHPHTSSGLLSSVHNPTFEPRRKQGRPVAKPNGATSISHGSSAQAKDDESHLQSAAANNKATPSLAVSPSVPEPAPKSPPPTLLPMVYDDSLDWADDLDE
ncbi:hypothetical protein H4R34_001000 [Dimargaris verticillata]|uniref:Uncharacterized protein n=1 Tax=Dimargaris verticillata TaxID=2761393 RepID=A0A9W8B5M1_9FUNG|nr:hypothetical protein H4R34_001000 [Dimargaris verticillata]